MVEITFLSFSYPVLGVNIKCIDAPKINTEEKINNYLNDDLKIDNRIIKINDSTRYLEYKVSSETENLYLWKVLHQLKPRSLRLITISLGWPNNKEANEIILKIKKKMPNFLKNIKFSEKHTVFDDIAAFKNKLKLQSLETKEIWKHLKITFPKRWKINLHEEGTAANIELEDKKFFLFFEKTEIELRIDLDKSDSIVTKLIEEMTKGLFLKDQNLKKTENNNYLYSFTVEEIEKDKENQITKNNIWYRIRVFNNIIILISFVFSYNIKDILKGELYSERLHKLISNSEIS